MPTCWEVSDEPTQPRYGLLIVIVIINMFVVANLCKIRYLVGAGLTATGLVNRSQLKSV